MPDLIATESIALIGFESAFLDLVDSASMRSMHGGYGGTYSGDLSGSGSSDDIRPPHPAPVAYR